jgi:selenide, water dikinase
VFRIDSERALVQTVDFFPPIVDDPRWFGRIAAANALSDVYAMGGRALTALNLVGWPKDLDVAILGEILAGGLEKLNEAGAVLCGGHSVTDQEIKYGLSVTGIVHPDRWWPNNGARDGDVVILTKPLGMGPVATAIKREKASPEMAAAAMAQMAELNKRACEALLDLPVHGATDVTGFGLMGHGTEMAGTRMTLVVEAKQLPLFPGALDLVRDGILSGGCNRGRAWLADRVRVDAAVDKAIADLCFDAETSGGLLVALPEDQVERARKRLSDGGTACQAVIGRFERRAEGGPALVMR